ncbi:phosphatase PAP2 family protein [Bartonella sp. DGB2]|uniref:phosphatase PAP2 family protein n=1 Tax=Bartonella sp. DGB2 TaxID=3388426 RepID=UPI0039901E70
MRKIFDLYDSSSFGRPMVLWQSNRPPRGSSYFTCRRACLVVGVWDFAFLFSFTSFMAGLGESLIQHKASASFPSSHSIIFAAYVYVLYFYRYKQVLLTALLACFFMGWGRVFVGVHYPFDIFGGFVLGASISWLVVRVATPWIPAFIYNVPPLKKP